jgi:hypothetical protein
MVKRSIMKATLSLNLCIKTLILPDNQQNQMNQMQMEPLILTLENVKYF